MSRIIKSMAVAALVSAGAPAMAEAPQKWTGKQLAEACKGHEGWSDPAPPAHIYGNTWYVGTCGITVLLVASDEGHVLVDSGPADAAPLVLANIRKLGFRPEDVRWIVVSHEHDDHVGGVAALQQATGAQVASLASARQTLASGIPSLDDPQKGVTQPFAAIRVTRVLGDGDSVTVGRAALTAHETPAHSPGSTSWTWQACDEKFTCRMIAYADSATTISADGYRFTDHPDRVTRARMGLAQIATLPCDVLVTPHPSASDLFAKISGKAAQVDPAACRTYARSAQERFDARLAAEEAAEAKTPAE